MPFVASQDWSPKGVAALEEQAIAALRETTQNVSVVASAGAGKTEFLAQKADYLLTTGRCRAPFRILAISFKVDAARELRERVAKRCGPELARQFDSRTYSAFTKGLVDRFYKLIQAPFQPAPDYGIYFQKDVYWNNLKRRSGANHLSTREAQDLTRRTQLPYDRTQFAAHEVAMLDLYWSGIGPDYPGHNLTFAMIDRLAEHIMRCNPALRAALHRTYPFVFLDEFQDTTVAQYDTLNTCFLGSDSILTAVGDDKQRIMGWAGAIPNAFGTYEPDFTAMRFALSNNWRSHEALVHIQHAIALELDDATVQPEAKALCSISGSSGEIWLFDNAKDEAAHLATAIGDSVSSGETIPSDYALLVRAYANNVENSLRPIFEKQGLSVRNLARNIGTISVEDIQKEPLTLALMPFLRLAVRKRSPEDWRAAQDFLRRARSVAADDELRCEAISKDLQVLLTDMRTIIIESQPNSKSSTALLTRIGKMFDTSVYSSLHPTYRRASGLKRAATGLVRLLGECADRHDSWPAAIDNFDGLNHVQILTVHKSKGMEFHTIFCIGIDSRWRDLVDLKPEELRGFYVALSRAKQRVVFTATRQNGGPVAEICTLLATQGMVVTEF